jgi:hypothetical protein
MTKRTWQIALGLLAGCTISAGQVFAQAPTTVQLPVIQVFSVNTTVSVPDGGGALLGGINRAGDSSVTRGLPLASKVPGLGRLTTNRGIGTTRSASNMSVHATIIDHHELDQAVLAQAAAMRTARAVDPREVAVQQKADYISCNLARTEKPVVVHLEPAAPSVEEIRRQNAIAAANRNAEAELYFAKAQAAEADGKTVVARTFYQMAARRAQGVLKQQADARVAALSSPSKSLVAR